MLNLIQQVLFHYIHPSYKISIWHSGVSNKCSIPESIHHWQWVGSLIDHSIDLGQQDPLTGGYWQPEKRK